MDTSIQTDGTQQYGIQKAPPRWLIGSRLLLIYMGAIAALVFYPPNVTLLLIFAISYAVRMFGAEAVYHRYFAHRAYRAGRGMQLILCFIGVMSGQRGPLWWAWTHHVHHKHADKPGDPHSPVLESWWRAQSGWFMDDRYIDTDLDLVRYYAKFPEIRWINQHYMTLFFGVAGLLFAAGHYGIFGAGVTGMAAACWGAFLPATIGIHLFSLVNSIAHGQRVPGGSRRFQTDDASRNRPILAILTLGTGWHNNHHRYAAAGRAGFAWYEVDISYYVLRLLELLGLIHDLRPVPDRIMVEGGLRERATAHPSRHPSRMGDEAASADEAGHDSISRGIP